MRYGKAAAVALMTFALACPWGGFEGVGEVGLSYAEAAEANAERQAKFYEAEGWRLRVPAGIAKEVQVECGTGNKIFSVSETASLRAAQKSGDDYPGAGWLFAIGKVSEGELYEMLCEDMSGRELFAKDGQGGYYIFYHPTDVRYVRQTPEEMQRDQEAWSRLTVWAYKKVRADFVKDNPGLTALEADNSAVGIQLAQILYRGAKYTLGRTGEEPIDNKGFHSMSYAEAILYGNSFRMVKKVKLPKNYYTLYLPETQETLTFFKRRGECYVRESRPGAEDIFYQALPWKQKEDPVLQIAEWRLALEAAKDMGKMEISPETSNKGWSAALDPKGQVNVTVGQGGGRVAISL